MFKHFFPSVSRLSPLDKLVLDCVENRLDSRIVEIWNRQVSEINKVQRLPDGNEVDFYRIKKGRPVFDELLAFPNRKPELLVAVVTIELVGMGKLTAEVWCVNGFLFSIEYEGSVRYFEEAASMEGQPDFAVSCDLMANLAERGLS